MADATTTEQNTTSHFVYDRSIEKILVPDEMRRILVPDERRKVLVNGGRDLHIELYDLSLPGLPNLTTILKLSRPKHQSKYFIVDRDKFDKNKFAEDYLQDISNNEDLVNSIEDKIRTEDFKKHYKEMKCEDPYWFFKHKSRYLIPYNELRFMLEEFKNNRVKEEYGIADNPKLVVKYLTDHNNRLNQSMTDLGKIDFEREDFIRNSYVVEHSDYNSLEYKCIRGIINSKKLDEKSSAYCTFQWRNPITGYYETRLSTIENYKKGIKAGLIEPPAHAKIYSDDIDRIGVIRGINSKCIANMPTNILNIHLNLGQGHYDSNLLKVATSQHINTAKRLLNELNGISSMKKANSRPINISIDSFCVNNHACNYLLNKIPENPNYKLVYFFQHALPDTKFIDLRNDKNLKQTEAVANHSVVSAFSTPLFDKYHSKSAWTHYMKKQLRLNGQNEQVVNTFLWVLDDREHCGFDNLKCDFRVNFNQVSASGQINYNLKRAGIDITTGAKNPIIISDSNNRNIIVINDDGSVKRFTCHNSNNNNFVLISDNDIDNYFRDKNANEKIQWEEPKDYKNLIKGHATGLRTHTNAVVKIVNNGHVDNPEGKVDAGRLSDLIIQYATYKKKLEKVKEIRERVQRVTKDLFANNNKVKNMGTTEKDKLKELLVNKFRTKVEYPNQENNHLISYEESMKLNLSLQKSVESDRIPLKIKF
ncbi:MAG: hypothetical protein Ta2D_11910 [Rickettsiales bacterium]|nr:MAG: hypothetical protein Ta2D_11910 [Rickettsiales bacterium]